MGKTKPTAKPTPIQALRSSAAMPHCQAVAAGGAQ
jgi:hypothetical protein